jgi:hypothetical protein
MRKTATQGGRPDLHGRDGDFIAVEVDVAI